MARVTVEDCVQVIPNRYELVLLAAQRARDISAGSVVSVDRDNDKNTVIALREIADQTINLDDLRRHIARGVNRQAEMSAEDDALLALAASAFGADATLDAANAAFNEVEYEAEEAPSIEEVDTEEGDDIEVTAEDLAAAGEEISDEDVKAAMDAMLSDMPELEAAEEGSEEAPAEEKTAAS